MPVLSDFLSPTMAARRLGCTRAYIYKLRHQGRLEALQTPLGNLYWRHDIERLAAERAARGRAR